MKKSGTQTVQNSGPFRRTFGVGIRAANALPMSILTLAALLLALTLLSAGAPPASAQVDTAATEVEVFENWSLKPSGVMDVGDKFRLLIVTSTALNASTTVMDSYNGIIRDSVAAGHTDIRPYSHLFNALGSTAAVDAIVNTKTTHTTTDMGVPIYYLNGEKVADNYSDFYDGTWDSPNPTNELGTSSSAMAVWTGSQSNGMKHANPLGNRTSKTVRMGNPTSSVSGDVLSATLISLIPPTNWVLKTTPSRTGVIRCRSTVCPRSSWSGHSPRPTCPRTSPRHRALQACASPGPRRKRGRSP